MLRHWSNLLPDPLAEVESVTLGDTGGDAHALVDTPADKLAVVEAVGDTPGDAHALVETLADTLAENEEKT